MGSISERMMRLVGVLLLAAALVAQSTPLEDPMMEADDMMKHLSMDGDLDKHLDADEDDEDDGLFSLPTDDKDVLGRSHEDEEDLDDEGDEDDDELGEGATAGRKGQKSKKKAKRPRKKGPVCRDSSSLSLHLEGPAGDSPSATARCAGYLRCKCELDMGDAGTAKMECLIYP